MPQQPRVLIVGGGFGGLAAARSLAGAPLAVTVIDRENHHCFQPLLYQVATAALEPADIAYPIRSVFRRQRNTSVLLDDLRRVDLAERRITLREGGDLAYDYLVLACGARTSYYGNDHWRLDAPGLKTVKDALDIRRRVLSAFEAAERCRDDDQRSAWMCFVVIGGGPTGVEMAGAIAEMARFTLEEDFDQIEPRLARVLLLQGNEEILADYRGGLIAAAERQLAELGVEIRCDCRVTDIDQEGVSIGDERIASRTVIWAAGVSPTAQAQRFGLPHGQQGVPVDSHLCLPEDDRVFVIGDLADAHSAGEPVPGVAPAAIQGGRHVARCIRADLRGRERPVFRYRDRGSMATIGRHRAVAQFSWCSLRGLPAWLVWGLVHIAMLVGFRSRIVVMVNWIWNWLTCRRGARVIIRSRQRRRRR